MIQVWGRMYPLQAEEMGWVLESPETEQGEVPSPAPWEERPQAPVRDGGHLTGKQHCRKGPRDPSEQQVDQEAVIWLCNKEG